MSTFVKAIEVFSDMSDNELISYYKGIKEPEIDQKGIVYEVIQQIFGKIYIIYLQINEVWGAFLEVVMSRFTTYSH